MNDRSLLRARGRTRHRAELEYTLAVEQTLANVRLVLTLVSVAAIAPLGIGGVALDAGMLALTLFAAAVVVALRLGYAPHPAHVVALHAVDVAGAILLALLTGGAASPFSTIFLFTLLAAGYRWGTLEVGVTCAVGTAALGLHAVSAHVYDIAGAPNPAFVVLRLSYLAMGGVLVGYMSGVERRQRVHALTATRILGFVGSNASVVTAVQGLLHEMLELFSASRLLLVVEEDSRDTATVWQAQRAAPPDARPVVTVTQDARRHCPMYLFPIPERVAAWVVSKSAGNGGIDGKSLIAVGRDGEEVEAGFSVEPLLGTPFEWTRAMALSYRAPHGMHARIFLFLPHGVRASRAALRDLLSIMREVGPAVVNLYLQRRLQSRSAVVDRTRISRELHDGVIQSLIGVEMQLEVTRREADGRVPASMVSELMHIQRIIGQEVLNVRDLMQMLKPIDVEATRLVEHLASTVEQFRQRTGIQASFACGVEDVDLTPRVCREIAGIVQEALTNVRKHSEATSVLVRLDSVDCDWRLTIDDNGKGFDFDGYLPPADVQKRRKGPLMIRERVQSIGGQVGIHSHPGFGAKLEITIPGKHHA